MASKVRTHALIKAIPGRRARTLQVVLRWLAVLCSSLAMVMLGKMLDGGASTGTAGLPGSAGSLGSAAAWGFAVSVVGAAIASALASAQGAATQSQTESSLRFLALRAWNRIGPVSARDRAGELLDLATNGAMRAARYRGAFLVSSLASLSAPVLVILVIGFAVSWSIAGWMALLIVVGPLLVGFFQQRTRGPGDRFRESQAHLRAQFLQGVNALESLSYASAAEGYSRALAKENEAHRRRIMSLLAGSQSLIFLMDVVFSLSALVLAAYLGYAGQMSGALTLGQAVSLVGLTLIMVGPVDLIGQFFYVGIGGRAAVKQFSALLTEADGAASAPFESQVADAGRSVQLDHVTAGWNEEQPVLSDATWDVKKGERVALVGPSGVGKSTVSALIQGHIHPFAGTVAVDGKLAVVEQRTYLFNGTIAENLLLAKPAASEEELRAALAAANLLAEIEAMPQGLETVVGDRGARLSGGQAQRLALARAFLREAPILILDEPTSQVDLSGEAQIIKAIDTVAEGKTVLTIAHRSAAASHAQRVFTIREGKVVPDA